MKSSVNTARKENIRVAHHPLTADYAKYHREQHQHHLKVQQYLEKPDEKKFDSAQEEIDFILNVADVLSAQHNYVHAVQLLIDVSDKFPDECRLYVKMASFLAKMGEHDDACAALREATRREPNNATYWLFAAQLFLEIDEYQGAHACLEKVFELQPQGLNGKRLLARLYSEIEQDEQAELIYKDIESTGVDDPDADVSKAKLRFRQGKLQEANSLYQSRFQTSDLCPDTYPQFEHEALWGGEDLQGKTLFIAMESSPHHLLFATLIKRISDAYPDVNLVIEATKKSEALLAESFPKARVFSCPLLTLNHKLVHMYDAHDFSFDYWIPAGSILHYIDTLPKPKPPLFTAHADKVELWHEHFKPFTNKVKVGINFQLYPSMLPQYDAWSDLLAEERFKFIALNPTEDHSKFDEMGILPCPYQAGATDAERAACISALDAVIAPFTDDGILAAGLGLNTILLTGENDWRMLGQKSSPWFGENTSSLHHTLQQDFNNQIAKMVKACQKILM